MLTRTCVFCNKKIVSKKVACGEHKAWLTLYKNEPWLKELIAMERRHTEQTQKEIGSYDEMIHNDNATGTLPEDSIALEDTLRYVQYEPKVNYTPLTDLELAFIRECINRGMGAKKIHKEMKYRALGTINKVVIKMKKQPFDIV